MPVAVQKQLDLSDVGTPIKHYGSVYVQEGWCDNLIRRMFREHGGFDHAASPVDADYIVWPGGEDLNPLMYQEKAIPGTIFNSSLDLRDVQLYEMVEFTAIKIGICRGGQLLNVINGGTLWQDCNAHNHGGVHTIKDAITGISYPVNTLHHQQMRIAEHGELIAYTRASTKKSGYALEWREELQGQDLTEVDVEAVWYPKTNSLCFQPHPEFDHQMTRNYFFSLIDRYCPGPVPF